MYLKFHKICRICLKENKLVSLNTKINENTIIECLNELLQYKVSTIAFHYFHSIITEYSFQRMTSFQNIYVNIVCHKQRFRLILSICVQILIKPYWEYWIMKKYK